MSYILRVRKTKKWAQVLQSSTFQNGLKRATRQIAVRTGMMKRTIIAHIISEMMNSPRSYWIIDLSNDKIAAMIPTFGAHWIRFHVRGYPRFNKKFAAGYKNATTPNTRPVERILILRRLKQAIKKAQE